MKRFIVLFLFASSVLLAQDIHVQTVTVGADTGRSSAYTAGYYGFTNVQATPVAFCTPASLETDSLYIEVYNQTLGTYQRLENANGTPILYLVEANKTYFFDNTIFRGVRQFKFANVSDVEDSLRTYTIIELE